jgi:virulence factor
MIIFADIITINMKSLIEKYKNKKKQAIISKNYQGEYAFVGIGSHSLNNLYPVLDYLKVNIKYIVTRSKENAALISSSYSQTSGTNDFDSVLMDPAIRGVFVCASPSQHFHIAQKVLNSGKHLFIEKPPCYSEIELQQLTEASMSKNLITVAGLQKRYAPVSSKLKAISSKATYYTMKYQTGAYPEGDALFDLFIHPIDLSVFLFGDAQIQSAQKIQRNSSAFTWLIHLKHSNGIIGSLELSTDFSWTGANEQITINTPRGIYHCDDMCSLTYTNKPKVIAGIPLEKVRAFNSSTEQIYKQNNFLPVKEHNQIFASGFYSEIKTFLDLCEGKKALNLSNFQSLKGTYKLLEQIKG